MAQEAVMAKAGWLTLPDLAAELGLPESEVGELADRHGVFDRLAADDTGRTLWRSTAAR